MFLKLSVDYEAVFSVDEHQISISAPPLTDASTAKNKSIGSEVPLDCTNNN